MSREMSLFCRSVLLTDGWAENVLLRFDDRGFIVAVERGAKPEGAQASGPVVPGMPNLHSHAFQRAMAGLAERAGRTEDDFWTWRDTMYRFLARFTPEGLQAVAALLYLEMLKTGYTSVAEFHYLHHDRAGTPYADRAENSLRIVAAARETGIRLTHLPTLYAHGGFGGRAPTEGQKRFLHTVEGLLGVVESVRRVTAKEPAVRVGLALHSLRAVTPEELREALAGMSALDARAPIHIHIAEQVKEVEDCLAWSGERPVQWLLNHVPVDARWCLVHATHLTSEEVTRLAASGAVAGLCPTTEANLGDGLFPAVDYLRQEGVFGVGSDSHISVSAPEELRLLEYGQRLVARRRNVLRVGSEDSVGAGLYRAAVAGGARALGLSAPGLEVGAPADLVVLDAEHPKLYGRTRDALLDSYLFASGSDCVRDVMVAGRFVVRERHHEAEDTLLARYRRELDRLLAEA
ncbi:formimidoylglutamate deiminase [Archangium violaceum]|uniref:formimidoylglutamate deiminase n=1 Tax=Archangium violaceum TaxID=83451 RepID=UPI002B326071|nr:formimidoylglutamate deiminase [Archangium violaceum]